MERVCVAQDSGESPARTVSVTVNQLTKSDKNRKCTGLIVLLIILVSQNAELVCTVTSAVCLAHPVASRTAATM